MNILCVMKTSGFERMMSSEQGQQKFARLRKYQQDALRSSHLNQKDFEIRLKTLIKQLGVGVDFVQDDKISQIDASNYWRIMTCGGDGTFLAAAQQFNDLLLIGLNSDSSLDHKKGSIGALTSINAWNLEERFPKIFEENCNVTEWKRLYVKVDDKMLPNLAVNDIFFGNLSSYGTCDFRLIHQNRHEDFNSSGLIVCTGMGSNAWFRNSGGTPFNNDLNAFGYIVREPNQKRHPDFTQGIIKEGQTLLVEPDRDGYVISFDSKNHKISVGITSTIEIGLSDKFPVKVIQF